MKSKLKKSLILGISGIALLGIGLVGGSNPSIQNSVQNAESRIEMPVSHADNSNKFNLSKRITTKQFTNISDDNDSETIDTDSELNRKVSKRVDKYLRSVNNLSDYHVHISRITTTASQGNSLNDSETATITFIRK